MFHRLLLSASTLACKCASSHPDIFSSIPTREENLKNLAESPSFDVVIIGGGATGTGAALDAATRGLKVACVEARDFSSATSCRSTKLIHGGVRYLEKAFWNLDYKQFLLVYDGLKERGRLLKNAPHITRWLPIAMPIDHWWQAPYFYVGLMMYQLISGFQKPAYIMGRDKVKERFPLIDKKSIKCGIVFFDGQMEDARLNLTLAMTAASKGATMANHVKVIELLKNAEGKVIGVKCKDKETGKVFDVKSKAVITAAGPFTDKVKAMDDPRTPKMVCPSAGIHLILPKCYCPNGMGLLKKSSDDRVLFLLPWEGHSIVGTTDRLCDVKRNIAPQEKEVEWVLRECASYFPEESRPMKDDILSGWSGIRPLAYEPNSANTSKLSRDQVIVTAPSGLISITGGKWTSYRKMAEDVVTTAVKNCSLKSLPSVTTSLTLLGGEGYTEGYFLKLHHEYGLSHDVATHLATHYGTLSPLVLDCASKDASGKYILDTIVPEMPYLKCEVIYAIRKEYARTVVDILNTRTRLAVLNKKAAVAAIPVIADLMAKELKWTSERKEKEIQKANKFLAAYI